MDCSEVKSLIDRWEKGGDGSPPEKESLSAHLQACESCCKRYGALVPFFLGIEETRSLVSGPVPDIASSVMVKIQSQALKRENLSSWQRFLQALSQGAHIEGVRGAFRVQKFAPVLALGLVLLIGGSIFFGVLPGTFPKKPTDEVTVRFTLEHVNARSVGLVGDFSDWKTYPLQRVGDHWEIQIKLKKGRVYTYNFVVDGEQWVPDPKIPFRVEDGFGGEATLLQL